MSYPFGTVHLRHNDKTHRFNLYFMRNCEHCELYLKTTHVANQYYSSQIIVWQNGKWYNWYNMKDISINGYDSAEYESEREKMIDKTITQDYSDTISDSLAELPVLSEHLPIIGHYLFARYPRIQNEPPFKQLCAYDSIFKVLAGLTHVSIDELESYVLNELSIHRGIGVSGIIWTYVDHNGTSIRYTKWESFFLEHQRARIFGLPLTWVEVEKITGL